jgi:hypothetical protein
MWTCVYRYIYIHIYTDMSVSYDEAMSTLQSMFPKWDRETLGINDIVTCIYMHHICVCFIIYILMYVSIFPKWDREILGMSTYIRTHIKYMFI